jgi:hypothetical protein
MEVKNIKKKFCSNKCRVYFNRHLAETDGGFVYCLKNPLEDNKVFYIGKTVGPLNKRLSNHICGKNKNTTFEFGTSNVLWRATLKALEFLPLANADYAGGIIVYDWYSDKVDSKEQIKISIKFLSNELKSSSIQVVGHKKICQDNEKCFTTKLDDKFILEVKDSIINSARTLKIADAKKEQEKN